MYLGFPQGGVCSAKFWIIAINKAIEIINSYGAFGNGFADDCVTMISGKNLKAMMNNLQKVVNLRPGAKLQDSNLIPPKQKWSYSLRKD